MVERVQRVDLELSLRRGSSDEETSLGDLAVAATLDLERARPVEYDAPLVKLSSCCNSSITLL